MTVGEKIQLYRKNMRMSQDELGQKLNVSRQTISLWETGQTLPTIDNLILLKDIFGVSVDELLSVADEKEEQKTDVKLQPPLESYSFNFTPQEYAKIHKISNKRNWFSLIVSIAVVVIWIVVLCVKTDDSFGDGTLFGLLLMLMSIYIGTIIKERKNRNKTLRTVCERVYRYDIYDGFLIATLFANGECIESSKIYYNKIDKVCDLGIYYIFMCGGQSFYIKKQELRENSLVFDIVGSLPRKIVEKSCLLKWSFLAPALNVISICTILWGLMLLSIFKFTGEEVFRYFWIFALFIPLTAASVVLGFYLKKTADKGRPNIIIGIVTTSLLFVLAWFSVFGPIMTKNANECIATVESCVDMDIPHYKEYNITNYASTSGTKKIATFTFAENKTEGFEYELMFSDKWLRNVPRSIEKLANYGYNADYADYLFVYNLDTGELNTEPSESGTYNFINGYYDVNDNEMTIVEYSYKFEK